MAEVIAIEVQTDTRQLQSTIDLLEKLGQVDAETAAKFRQANEQTKQSISGIASETKKQFDQLDKSVKQVGNTLKTAVVFDGSKDVVKTANAFTSLRQQVKLAQAEVAILAEKYGPLDQRTVAAARRAADLKENLADVNAQINALNPEAKFTAFTQLGSSLQGAFAAATGALQLFGAESEEATKLAQKFQGALNIAAGLNSLTGLKDAFTNLRAVLGITTAATVAQGAATEGATVANNALNASLRANPVFITIAAITALASAYLILSDNAGEAAQSTEDLNRTRLEAFKNVERERVETGLLVDEFKNENTSRERRTAIIEDLQGKYPAYFSNLDAENTSVDQLTKAYGRLTNALIIKAQIDALVQRIADVNIKNFEEQQKGIDGQVSGIEKFFLSLLGGAGVQETINIGTQRLTQSQEEAATQTELFKNKIKELQSELEKLGGDPNKRVTENKAALEKQTVDTQDYYKNAVSLIEQYYRELRVRDGAKIQDSELFKQRNVEITQDEYREKIAAAIKYGEDYTKFLEELQKISRDNVITPIVKIDQIQRTSDQPGDEAITAEMERQGRIYDKSVKQQQALLDAEKEFQDTRNDILKDSFNVGINAVQEYVNARFDIQREALQRELELQTQLLDQEDELNNSRYAKRLIGVKEFNDTQRSLDAQRAKANEDFRKKEIELKRKEDLANRARALFEIGVSTARNIIQQPGPAGGLIAFWSLLGAAQAGAVLARPLPKYQKGTLSLQRGANQAGVDTIPVLANEGEAIIPTEKSRAYRTTLEAVMFGKIPALELNAMVRNRMKDARKQPVFAIDYDQFAQKVGSEIAWRMRGDSKVIVKNASDIADAILSAPFNRNR